MVGGGCGPKRKQPKITFRIIHGCLTALVRYRQAQMCLPSAINEFLRKFKMIFFYCLSASLPDAFTQV